MEIVFLVEARWKFDVLPIVSFRLREDADFFAQECEAYQGSEPEDGVIDWEDGHPARQYVTARKSLAGIESFAVREFVLR